MELKIYFAPPVLDLRLPVQHCHKSTFLPVVMIQDCPELPMNVAMDLLEELERSRTTEMVRRLQLTLLRADMEGDMDTHLKALKNDSLDFVDYQLIFIKFLVKFFPDVPDRLLQRLVPGCPNVAEGEKKFMNRRQRKAVQRAEKVVVNLFSGAQKWTLSDNAHVVSVEKEKGQDLH